MSFSQIKIAALLGAALCSSYSATLANQILVPKPVSVLAAQGGDWDASMGLSPIYGPNTSPLKPFAEAVLQESGIGSGTNFEISLDLPVDSAREEGYLLSINPSGCKLRAATATGLYYGLQSLRHLLLTGSTLGSQVIYDYPAQSWRGLMLDIARNFMPVSYLKSTIDRMGTHKLNRLHLHMTDDQGWRLESLKWPKLHEIGSQSATLGAYGYMTQAEYVELQDYASSRGVVIVPEFDMPGHTNAVSAAYPNLGCGSKVSWPYTKEFVGFSKLCMTKDSTRTFVRDVLGELSALTKGPWIHFGGDEITDTSYVKFVGFLDSTVYENGKIAMGWSEITDNVNLNPQTIWQKWKTSPVTNLVNNVNSICKNAYFDHPEVKGAPGLTWCILAVTDTAAYAMPGGSVGVEAALWGERVPDTLTSLDRLYPRLYAFSEAAWTPSASKNFADYKLRSSSSIPTALSVGMEFSGGSTKILPSEQKLMLNNGVFVANQGAGSLLIYDMHGKYLWGKDVVSNENIALPMVFGHGTKILVYAPKGAPLIRQIVRFSASSR